MKHLLCLLCLVSVAYAQKYEGYLGITILQRTNIEIYRADRSTRYFRGFADFVPGMPLPITGTIKAGWFKVDGWFITPVQFSWEQIMGHGVWLVRK